MSKKALGKGINALFKDIDEKINMQSVIQIPVDSIKPNPYQPRKKFIDDNLQELADSIKLKGIIQPIIAEQDKDDTYILISGERRVRAAKLAGLSTVPAILGNFSVIEKLENALIENIQRENLSPLEEAEGYKLLMDTFNLNQEEISKKMGKNRSTIANTIRLLKLPKKMKNDLAAGIITAGHARAILSLINPSDQDLLYKAICEKNLSVRGAEKYAGELNKGNKTLSKKLDKKITQKNKVTELRSMEDQFIEVFGTKVELKGSLQKGKIEIHYYSMDDLDRILSIISKRKT
ncbi:MAG: ParB/RepB/Spo0J family partition protein [Spirochaetales bacterium]|nr:ParB/RepB/Spo0J family partition protein [Spirochaetales bacterium]